MRASSSLVIAAATVSSAQNLLSNTEELTASSTSASIEGATISSVSYLVAAYEQLATTSPGTAPTLGVESEGAISGNLVETTSEPDAAGETTLSEAAATSTSTTSLTTLATATGLTPAAAQATSSSIDMEAAVTQESVPSSIPLLKDSMKNGAVVEAAAAGDATLIAASAELGMTGLTENPSPTFTTSTSLGIEMNSVGAGCTQESLSLLPMYTSATRTYTPSPGQATSYPSPQPLTTGNQYDLSPDAGAMPTASLPSYVRTITHAAGSSASLSTVTSDCGDSTMISPLGSHPPSSPPAMSTAAPPPSVININTFPLVPVMPDPEASSGAGPGNHPAPTDALGVPPAIPVPSEPIPETPCSEATGEMSHSPPTNAPQAPGGVLPPPPSLPTTGAYTNVWSASELSLPVPALPTTAPDLMPPAAIPSLYESLNTTLSTIPRPTVASTTMKQADLVASSTTTFGGGFSQGSGTADPALFAGRASSMREPSKVWLALAVFVAVTWII